MTTYSHKPVMLSEVVDLLSPKSDGCYVDGTFGAGGYSRALLNEADCYVHAFDRDPLAVAQAKAVVEDFAPRLTLHTACFSEMEAVLNAAGINEVDGVALDIGVSSIQLSDPKRGFSFSEDGPLDMRMGNQGLTAEELVNSASEDTLARLLKLLGEERQARRIAKAIVVARSAARISSTVQLANIIERAASQSQKSRIHPATKSFQAIRIYLNNELEELAKGLAAAERLLKPAGRLVVVAFHSLEDRIIKRFFTERFGQAASVSRHSALPSEIGQQEASFRRLFRRAKRPTAEEVRGNPRARSAKLRAGERTSSPSWPLRLSSLGVPSGVKI